MLADFFASKEGSLASALPVSGQLYFVCECVHLCQAFMGRLMGQSELCTHALLCQCDIKQPTTAVPPSTGPGARLRSFSNHFSSLVPFLFPEWWPLRVFGALSSPLHSLSCQECEWARGTLTASRPFHRTVQDQPHGWRAQEWWEKFQALGRKLPTMVQRGPGFHLEPHRAHMEVPVPGERRQSGWVKSYSALWQKTHLPSWPLWSALPFPAHGATAGARTVGRVLYSTRGGRGEE